MLADRRERVDAAVATAFPHARSITTSVSNHHGLEAGHRAGLRADVGTTRIDPLRDTVTSAPELARLTQNLAPVHRDPTAGGGRRLVYGGHTIGLAQASLHRLMPSTATVLGWQACDHTGPVYEDDVLGCTHTLIDERQAAGGRLRAMRVAVEAERNGDTVPVLEWHLVTWGA